MSAATLHWIAYALAASGSLWAFACMWVGGVEAFFGIFATRNSLWRQRVALTLAVVLIVLGLIVEAVAG